MAYFSTMAPNKEPNGKKPSREEIMRAMIASFRIEGIRITAEVAERLLKKIEIRLASAR